jgi:hypothetical protein
MKYEFNPAHPSATVTMSDGNVIHAESAVGTMPTTLFTRLYNTYSSKTGILHLKFSNEDDTKSVIVRVPSLSPSDREDIYIRCIDTIYATLKLVKGMVYIKIPQKDEWVHISSLVSEETDPSTANNEHDEQAVVSRTFRRPDDSTHTLRDEF